MNLYHINLLKSEHKNGYKINYYKTYIKFLGIKIIIGELQVYNEFYSDKIKDINKELNKYILFNPTINTYDIYIKNGEAKFIKNDKFIWTIINKINYIKLLFDKLKNNLINRLKGFKEGESIENIIENYNDN